jgi:iron complex transport system substrate-binding protein
LKYLSIPLLLSIAVALNSCGKTAKQPVVQRPECVKNYRAERDYFPDKTQILYAQGFQVEYHKHYKVITVKNPWRDAKQTFQYVLVQCGTPVPAGFEQVQVVEVPVRRVVVLSTTHLGHLESLKLLNTLVGMSDPKLSYSKTVQEHVQRSNIPKIGTNANLNVEKVLDLSPDLITTYGTGDPKNDSHPKLLEAGLKVAINAEYMESTPLGQAEWLKFTALFFNQEKAANQQVSTMAQAYQKIVMIAKRAKRKPTVLTDFSSNGTWYQPGGNSYVARLLKDAGAEYLGAGSGDRGSIPMSFEAVYDRALKAQVWINGSQTWKRLSDVAKADERYQKIPAFQTGQVFNNNARVNEFGGNDYWQSGILRPQVVLADLVKILHPELLSDRRLVYYRLLQ